MAVFRVLGAILMFCVHHPLAALILTGAAGRYSMLALPLWITALEHLGSRQVKHCSTLVSAANIGVVNLYARLGFRYDTTLFGYRKFL